MVRKISAVVAGFDALGLKPGDHLVTVLQNRWEAATLHWACQFAGIIITPINWRAKADEIDFCVENAEAKAIVYEDVSAEALPKRRLTRRLPTHRGGVAGVSRRHRVCGTCSTRTCRRDAKPRVERRSLVADALHVRHDGEAEGRAAPAARRARRRGRPCRAEPICAWRAHARRHAALSHDGRALAARHVADRRRCSSACRASNAAARCDADRGARR